MLQMCLLSAMCMLVASGCCGMEHESKSPQVPLPFLLHTTWPSLAPKQALIIHRFECN